MYLICIYLWQVPRTLAHPDRATDSLAAKTHIGNNEEVQETNGVMFLPLVVAGGEEGIAVSCFLSGRRMVGTITRRFQAFSRLPYLEVCTSPMISLHVKRMQYGTLMLSCSIVQKKCQTWNFPGILWQTLLFNGTNLPVELLEQWRAHLRRDSVL